MRNTHLLRCLTDIKLCSATVSQRIKRQNPKNVQLRTHFNIHRFNHWESVRMDTDLNPQNLNNLLCGCSWFKISKIFKHKISECFEISQSHAKRGYWQKNAGCAKINTAELNLKWNHHDSHCMFVPAHSIVTVWCTLSLANPLSHFSHDSFPMCPLQLNPGFLT